MAKGVILRTGAGIPSDLTATPGNVLFGRTFIGANRRIESGMMGSLGATTYYPGTQDQSIPAGLYLSGDQTINGDTNLLAGNIKAGVTIFGVTGTYG